MQESMLSEETSKFVNKYKTLNKPVMTVSNLGNSVWQN